MKNLLYACAVCLLLVGTGSALRAQDAKGFRADLTGQLEYNQKQVLDLLNAIPDGKMTWRPDKEVRSISEVYSHIAYSNYFLLKFAGVAPPEGITLTTEEEATTFEKMSTDKKVIHEQLVKSFDFARKSIGAMSDASLENPVDFFGQKMSTRGMLLVLLGHLHEHLGQSIAYARMEGVVPPWTAAQQAAAKEKK